MSYMAWIKAGAIVLVLAATFGAGYRYRDARADAQVATIREQIANDARLQIEAAQKQAYDAENAYEELKRSLPKGGTQARANVAANPRSPDCRLPDPDVRVRQSQEREANRWTE